MTLKSDNEESWHAKILTTSLHKLVLNSWKYRS